MLLNAGQGMLHSVEQVPAIVARMQAVVGAVEGLVRRVDAVVARAGVVVENVDAMRADADATVLAVQQIERQASMLVDRCEPLLGAVIEIDPKLVRATQGLVERLQPLLTAATSLDPKVPGQAAQLLTRSGPLLDRVDATALPLLTEMQAAVPDVRDILVQRLEPVMVDVETRVAGLPGAARLCRRGEGEIERANSDDS